MKVRYSKITKWMAMAAFTAIGLIFMSIGSTAHADPATNQTVLVVYSQEAASASANVYAEINNAETATNAAYTNSLVNLQISIVNVLTTTYSESGDLNTDLARLTGTADGYLDYIHDLRNQYNADMVVLIVENGGGSTELAWLHDPPAAGDESTAFAVVVRSAATANLDFPHALGHIQGLRHDCSVDAAGTAIAHGYVDAANFFRTIMASNNACAPSSCTRIPYFSNPAVNYLGNPTGVVDGGCDADAETALENSAPTVANWRNSATADTDGDGVPDTEDASPANAAVATPPSSTGAGQVTIQTSSGTLAGVRPIQDTDPSVGQAGKPAGYSFGYGLFKFNVTGMGAGAEITVTLTFPAALPAGTRYYEASAGGGFVEYPQAVIAGNTIILTLKDGDLVKGDSDGAANNTITHSGGPDTCAAKGDLDGDGLIDCADDDIDGDGEPNITDGCPYDPQKADPGVCGCGVADTDTDTDGTPDCNDGCPADPLKIAAGSCGCGVADTDTDLDGTLDCHDGCPVDINKVLPGQCGCGVADTDTDSDGIPNCHDGCPADPLKFAAGVCGCGVADTDMDGDGTADCNDGCPGDPAKLVPGMCGCGVADTDSDGDGTADCNDDDTPDGEGEETCADTPRAVLPGNGATGVSSGPTLEIAFNVDPSTCGEHDKTWWQISESPDFSNVVYRRSLTGDGPVSVQVAPGTLKPETTCYWRAMAWCGSGCRSAFSEAVSFTTGPVPNDTNGNGIPDEQEPSGETDVNEDGQPDVQGGNFRVLMTVAGNGLVALETTGNITFLQSLDPDDMTIKEGLPAYMPWGLVNFRIEIENSGDTAQVTIYFSEAAPAGSVLYLYDPVTGWLNFTGNATFAPDMKSVVIKVQDGGFGDLDGVANAVVVNLFGIGADAEPLPDDDGDGGNGGSCFLRTVMNAPSR